MNIQQQQQILPDKYSYLKHINSPIIYYIMLQQRSQLREPKVYSIQVSGIRCTNCSGKIKKALNQRLADINTKVAVNIMQETISLTVFYEQSMLDAVEILKEIGYPPIKDPVMVAGGEENHRSISFLVTRNNEVKLLELKLPKTLGVLKVTFNQEDPKLKINLTYNCQIIKGRQIADLIEAADKEFKVINARIDAFSTAKKAFGKQVSMFWTMILCLYFFIVNMVLPVLPFSKGWHTTMIQYPPAWGIFSISVILNSIIVFYVMGFYARGFIERSWKNFHQYNSTNMETLISLGSVSAFILYLFFLVRYTLETVNDQMMDVSMAIMDITDALTAAAIIVLVVTIGKHFENKIKQRIQKITQQIFPESVLFQNMKVQYVDIKNRQLKIVQEKTYDVSLIEKNDILKITKGRMLVDLILISGKVKAVQSARTGCDDIVELTKGERIQSGAVICEEEGALAIVENVLEKSLLIEIGTQIKMAQNQEQSQETGIQAVCRKIASIFVRAVIVFSLLTMIVWSVLLIFQLVTVPMCNVCWIVQRGIGVLVASCPCALGLAVPSVIAIILNLATKSGILIKNNNIFEKMKMANKISFDKTGTLFTRIGKIEEHLVLSPTMTEQKMWEIVALIQKQIRHPLAEILYKQAFLRSQVVGTNYGFILLQKPKTQKEGVCTQILDKVKAVKYQVLIGNRHLLMGKNIDVPAYKKMSQASTELFLVVNNQVLMIMLINTHSNLRPQARDVIAKIQRQNMEVHILSGDSVESVEKIGLFLNIPQNCLHPEHSAFMKMRWIKQSQEDNKGVVIMIGDGLNDIPCLQQAGIGISINAKSELNINAADVVILSQNLYKILALTRFIKRGNLFIKINLFWAFAYNIVIMPIVAGALFPLNIFVSPVWSSIAMSGSSLLVVGFSHLLSLFHYDDSLIEQKQNRKGAKTYDFLNQETLDAESS